VPAAGGGFAWLAVVFTAIMPGVLPDPVQQIRLAPDCGIGSWAAAA